MLSGSTTDLIRDIEDLLAERSITVSREAIRLWCIKFGALYARRLRRKHRGFGDTRQSPVRAEAISVAAKVIP